MWDAGCGLRGLIIFIRRGNVYNLMVLGSLVRA